MQEKILLHSSTHWKVDVLAARALWRRRMVKSLRLHPSPAGHQLWSSQNALIIFASKPAQHVRQVNLSIYVNIKDWILGWSWCIWGVPCWRNLRICTNNTLDSFELYLVLGIAGKQVFSRFLFWLWKPRVMLGSRCNFFCLFFTMSQLLSSIQIVGLNRRYIFFIQCWDMK